MKKMMMIAAMMLMSIGAFAQNEVGQVTLKPMVGMNLATMTKVDDSKMRVGLTAGVEAEYGVAQNFSVTAGLLYSMQGVKNEGTADIDLSFLGYDVRVPLASKLSSSTTSTFPSWQTTTSFLVWPSKLVSSLVSASARSRKLKVLLAIRVFPSLLKATRRLTTV